MGPVELDIVEVVDEVPGTRYRTEGGKGEQGLPDSPRVINLARKQQPGENQDVLDPLVRTCGLDRSPQRGSFGGCLFGGRRVHDL